MRRTTSRRTARGALGHVVFLLMLVAGVGRMREFPGGVAVCAPVPLVPLLPFAPTRDSAKLSPSARKVVSSPAAVRAVYLRPGEMARLMVPYKPPFPVLPGWAEAEAGVCAGRQAATGDARQARFPAP